MGKCWMGVRGFGLSFVLLSVMRVAGGQTVSAVPKLDIERFTGTWYEVARLPDKREKNCVRNSIVLISRGDKPRSFEWVTACQKKQGYTDANNQNGRSDDLTGSGKLKVRSLWPFWKHYWVLAVGTSYEWSLVGSPNHKELWVLSRTTALKPEVLAEIKGQAAGEGFAVDKLVMQAQGERYQTY